MATGEGLLPETIATVHILFFFQTTLRMLAIPVQKFAKFSELLWGLHYNPHVKILTIDPYFSFAILKI